MIESPRALIDVRSRYPASSIRFVRVPPGTDMVGLGQTSQEPRVRTLIEPAWLSLSTFIIGAVVGGIGFANREKAWGQVALGAGSSMIGTSFALVLRDTIARRS